MKPLLLLVILLAACTVSPPLPTRTPTQTPPTDMPRPMPTWMPVQPTPTDIPTLTRLPTPTRVPPAPASSGPPGSIPWDKAGNYSGQVKTVCGPIVSGSVAPGSKGSPTFLDMGERYPNPTRFSILIWGEHRPAFPQPPESFYPGKTVCSTGKIVPYGGAYEMEVTQSTQISIQ